MTVAHLLLLTLSSKESDFRFCIVTFLALEHRDFFKIALTGNNGKIPTSANHTKNDHLCYPPDNYFLEKVAN